ncbi:hypothetical protein [Desulfogranum marinum]|uniref:hypothetical protein n=1 Tax=Desulfogranum marinum TaxID=453220 RepID=UPI0029C70169|nr:hypothetical protein [Desulfogranum marinum]
MYSGKFIDKTQEEQQAHVRQNFAYTDNQGWFSLDGEFAGATLEDVIKALIDLEDAEINSIGDCMSGFCVTPPKLSDFVRKP